MSQCGIPAGALRQKWNSSENGSLGNRKQTHDNVVEWIPQHLQAEKMLVHLLVHTKKALTKSFVSA